jgi:hypothetical protein
VSEEDVLKEAISKVTQEEQAGETETCNEDLFS